MPDILTRRERLDLIAELCPRAGVRRACDSAEFARRAAESILGPAERAELTADFVLMRAVDRYVAGEITLADLYRCRLLAYYIVFASGGEEWARWGVAAAVRPGDFPPESAEEQGPGSPPGAPWRIGDDRSDRGSDAADTPDPR